MSKYVWGDEATKFFFQLGPELILDSVDRLGLKTTGRCLPLNSMENRVYEIETEDRFVIGKFYRPGRWSKQQILEEHQFLLDLKEAEIPVIAPLQFDGETLFQLKEIQLYYSLFPKQGGRPPEEMNKEQLEIMGRNLARLHNIGASRTARHRLHLTPETFGRQNLDFIIKNNFVPSHLLEHYHSIGEQLLKLITPLFSGIEYHRIHGDCHRGNILCRDNLFYLIDFDDMLVGPAVQDIWPLIPGVDQEAINSRNILLESYQSMRDFDYRSLRLIEPLRALRYIHFAAWIAARWEDPAFKNTFEFFSSERYWETLLNDLRTQFAEIQEQQSIRVI